ncbi:F0F1 ATP synthase subunit B/delta [Gordonia rhizosphera]|uniref:ATP synthase subunit delta n=1 Tax=Gordonia rhizosphera NBRC 16068 TaxID=1108045 RepID=K6VNJ5_9ACTN|nr:F0F1 ATP synthase subunit B/delta [Gordonia rhizosphera]GAB88480.1 ATP synthase subunit delta [Gordonia rhizosphera NBRC 16068]
MDLFIGQLIGFAVIAFLFWRFVLPPLKRAVVNQQDVIGRQITDSAAAKSRVVDAQAAHDRALAQARSEAEELHNGALQDAKGITEDIAAQADAEVQRIHAHGAAQGELARSNMVRQLRSELGLSAVDGAGDLVRSHLTDPDARSRSIDRVIDELEAMSVDSSQSVPGNVELLGLHSMRAGSRESARQTAKVFDEAAAGLDGPTLTNAADELVNVLEFLHRQPVLRKKMSEVSEGPAAKENLVRRLFEGKVSPLVLTVLISASNGRWSSTADYITGLRRQAAMIVLTAAERDGSIERVEDELFRVGRVLDANPELASLLSDHTRDADRRVEMLRSLVGDQVHPHTWYLLSHQIRLLHGQPSEVAVDRLAQLAAARRGEVVAHVVSPTGLTDAQKARLSTVLGTIYGRTISVQTEIDPQILGGLRIGVGDELIEADVATRLAKAAESLPR